MDYYKSFQIGFSLSAIYSGKKESSHSSQSDIKKRKIYIGLLLSYMIRIKSNFCKFWIFVQKV